jgi:CspA family cold shock protein
VLIDEERKSDVLRHHPKSTSPFSSWLLFHSAGRWRRFFAHVRDFASPIDGIRRGDPVTYIVGKDHRNGKFRARNITRLPKEQFTGTVTAYSVDRGFGFIAPDNNFLDDVCVKESNLQESGIDKLETGDRVSFELLPKHHAHPRRGAVNLRIIESSHG